MDTDDNDSSKTSNSLLNRLFGVSEKTEADTPDQEQFSIQPIAHRSITSEPSHDVNKEITDLENLIRKLQVEIAELAENASKPLVEFFPIQEFNQDTKTSIQRDFVSYPVSETNETSDDSGQVSDDQYTDKLLQENSNFVITGDSPEGNIITIQKKDDDRLVIPTDDSNNNVLDDFVVAKKAPKTLCEIVDIVNQYKEKTNENISEFNEIEITNVAKQNKANNANNIDSKICTENKPHNSNIHRLGILMHIFREKENTPETKIDDVESHKIIEKSGTNSALDLNSTKIEFDQPEHLTDELFEKSINPKINSTSDSNIKTSENIEILCGELFQEFVENPDTSVTMISIANQSKDALIIKNEIEISSDTNEQISNKSNTDYSNDESTENKFLVSNDLNDTLTTPCYQKPLDGSSNFKNETPIKIDNTHLRPNNHHRSITPPLVEINHNETINRSKDSLSEEDLIRLAHIQKKMDSNVPGRLSIINIYLDSQNPSSTAAHKKQNKLFGNINPNIKKTVQATKSSNSNPQLIHKGNIPPYQKFTNNSTAFNEKYSPNTDVLSDVNNMSISTEKIEILDNLKKTYNKNVSLMDPSVTYADSNTHISNSDTKVLDVLHGMKNMNTELESSGTKDIGNETNASVKILENAVGNTEEPTIDEVASSPSFESEMPNEAFRQTEIRVNFTVSENNIANALTSNQEDDTHEKISSATNLKSINNLSDENDLTDEYESVAEDIGSCSDESISLQPHIFIHKTEITINNGDTCSDIYEDSEDFLREATHEHSPKKTKRKGK